MQLNGKRIEFMDMKRPGVFPIQRLSFEYVTADDAAHIYWRVVKVFNGESQSEECPTEPLTEKAPAPRGPAHL